MFTFRKKDTNLLVKKSGLIENEALKNAILDLENEAVGGFTGYRELAYERYIFEKIIHEIN
ncbi:hypothetical protein SY27_01510 [Flavobacterium sp. 316]|uniref:hypothetical protein n=1 Tax=Flavobacterium sp. 316 TaxID=1603293 RepID=UPI0005DAE07C|nr:hypothetical protein [Flavobacterium sp. 316]KIX22543.1 hypothetical protein SY27_01510 [Flavobacterium sp. 316]